MTRLEAAESANASSPHRRQLPQVLIFALVAALVAGELGRYYWALDLFVHFRVQYALAFALAALVAFCWRQRFLALLALTGCVFAGWPVLGFAYLHGEKIAHDRSDFRLVSFNAGFWNEHYREIGAFLESTQSDAIILLEYRNDQLDRLAPFLPSYRYRTSDHADLRYGAAILSRWPIAQAGTVELAASGAAAAHARIATAAHEIEVFGVHLSWPATPLSARRRQAELAKLSGTLASCKPNCVVAGDFNLTQWSWHFKAFQQRSGWKNCAAGQRIVRTWPNLIWPLGIQIDQCLVSPDVGVRRFARGPSMGSDHFAIVIDLALDSL